MSNATTTAATQKETANEILRQLGGNKFIAMTGAHSFGFSADAKGRIYIQMKLRKNKSKANFLRITLTPMDVYNMEFMQLTKDYEFKAVYSLDGAYCDMLQSVFTRVTGMNTCL